MSRSDDRPTPARVRREPPRFRRVEVRGVDPLSTRMARVTVTGAELDGLTVDDPAASVRLLLPTPGSRDLVMPVWNGNEFLLPGGRRPIIRTLTPYRVDTAAFELELWIVVHPGGVLPEWAGTAGVGDAAAISGPGRGYTVDRDAPGYLLAGDESAIPAIHQLLAALPAEMPVHVYIEVADPDGRRPLPPHPRATVTWCDLPAGAPPGDALVNAVHGAGIDARERVWAAGEAAAMQRIRRHLFEDRGLPRTQAAVRGYWKRGRGGDPDDG